MNMGNYNQISSIPLQDEIIEDIAVVKNGKLITCTTKIKMWS